MTSQFPQFEPLGSEHKQLIESYAAKFPPYSDFNFTSLYCYNTTGSVGICTLNDNLVVRFSDYITRKLFYAFLGDTKTSETAHALLERARQEGSEPELKLIPTSSLSGLHPDQFHIAEDEDNFDYILPVSKLKTYAGNQLGGKRNFVNRFKKNYRWERGMLRLDDPTDQKAIMDMFDAWAHRKGSSPSDAENERIAIERSFHLAGHPGILVPALFIEGKLAGFAIVETVGDGHAILHFEKADDDAYVGIYQMMMMETANVLSDLGCTAINYEQDLGIPGLKKAKKSYAPSHHLKKHRVTWKQPGQ